MLDRAIRSAGSGFSQGWASAFGRLLAASDIASTQVQSFYAIADGSNATFNTADALPSAASQLARTAGGGLTGGR